MRERKVRRVRAIVLSGLTYFIKYLSMTALSRPTLIGGDADEEVTRDIGGVMRRVDVEQWMAPENEISVARLCAEPASQPRNSSQRH